MKLLDYLIKSWKKSRYEHYKRSYEYMKAHEGNHFHEYRSYEIERMYRKMKDMEKRL